MARSKKLRLVAASAVATLLLAGFAVLPGSAAAPAALSERDCEELQDLSENIPDVDTGDLDEVYGAQADALAVGFEDTADNIKNKKLRKSLRRMAGFYEDLGDADSVSDAVGTTLKFGKKWAKSFSVVARGFAECITTNLTIPSLPGNITIPSLPGNITIPSLPR